MATLTSANSVVVIGVSGLLPPTAIQGYTTDDIFDADPIDNAETQMGLDGLLSAGWVPVPVSVHFMLQANSPSMTFFEAWYGAEQTLREKMQGFATIKLAALNRIYTGNKCFLRNYQPLSNAKRIMQPRAFTLQFESLTGSPV